MAQAPTYDWPNPRGYTPAIDLRTWVQSPSLLLNTFRTFFVTDWAVPYGAIPSVVLKTWLDPVVLRGVLKGKDQFFSASGMGPDYDYPLPIGHDPKSRAQPSILLKTWIDPVKLLLAGKDTIYGTFGQVPDYDYPNPRGYVPVIDLRTWIDPLKLLLLGKDTIYGTFGQVPDYDWPNPPGYRRPPADFINQTEIQLIGQDRIYGPAGMAPDYDYPNPRGPRRSKELLAWFQSGDQISSGVPFSLLDWPVPKSATPGISLKTWLDALKLNLQSQDKFFGLAGVPQFDWPNPRGYIPNIVLKTWLDTYKINLPGQDSIYGAPGQAVTYDWQNPRGYVPDIELKSWTSDSIRLNVYDAFFVAEWAVPYAAKRIEYTWLQSQVRTLPTPFKPSDFPLPKVVYHPMAVSHNVSMDIAGVPFVQVNWPVPKGPIHILAVSHNATLDVSAVPFFQTNWPVPKGPVQILSIAINTVLDISAVPFSQFEWLTPRRLFPVQPEIANNTVTQTTVTAASPFVGSMWPNPIRPVSRAYLQEIKNILRESGVVTVSVTPSHHHMLFTFGRARSQPGSD